MLASVGEAAENGLQAVLPSSSDELARIGDAVKGRTSCVMFTTVVLLCDKRGVLVKKKMFFENHAAVGKPPQDWPCCSIEEIKNNIFFTRLSGDKSNRAQRTIFSQLTLSSLAGRVRKI